MNAPSARENAEVALATAWPDTARQDCIRMIQTSCGGSDGMGEALREFVPELGRTIGQILEANPARLLEWLKRQQDERAVADLLDELRSIGSEARR